LLQRIKKRNFEVWVVPFSLIYHKVGATTGKGAFLNKKDFFYQHEIIFYMRYFPIFFIFRFFKSIMRAIIEKRVFFLLKSYKKGWDKRKEKQINFLSN
jgi:GT2 family glycosyltransferase